MNILATRWLWTTDPRGKRGEGLYLVGNWWRYQRGELIPHVRLGTIARRYLSSFENERWNTLESDQIPYRWFRNARAETFKLETITGTASQSQTGTIEDVSVTNTGSERIVKVTFRGSGEGTVVYSYGNTDDADNNDILNFIGDAATGLVYPLRYTTAKIELWLKGKRATLRTYGTGDRSQKVLWLER